MATAKQIRSIYNIDDAQLQKWRGLGLPAIKLGRGFQYEPDKVEEFYKAYIQPNQKNITAQDITLAEIKRKLELERTENIKIKNDILRKRYIDKKDVEVILIARASAFKEAILRIKQAVLILSNNPSLEPAIDKIISEALEELLSKS